VSLTEYEESASACTPDGASRAEGCEVGEVHDINPTRQAADMLPIVVKKGILKQCAIRYSNEQLRLEFTDRFIMDSFVVLFQVTYSRTSWPENNTVDSRFIPGNVLM
jgi:hypothetical protein